MKNNFFCRSFFLSLFFLHLYNYTVWGQDMRYIKQSIATLASPSFGGRGYVSNSRDKAARFLARNFAEIGLMAFDSTGQNYYQDYFFPVNTFPNRVELKLGKQYLDPGSDFLVDAASVRFYTMGQSKVQRINLNKVKDSADWQKLKSNFQRNRVYQLRYWDSFCKRQGLSTYAAVQQLPTACYIIPQTKKLVWTVATDTIKATVFYVLDTVMPRSKKVEVFVHNKFIPQSLNRNIVGYIKGTQFPDSFVVFTAHYDHLGKMGQHAIFPGANDNASGTAFLLALAQYFKANPPKYSIAFMMFSGEEAGLLGSSYYVAHPIFSLTQIKFLINIDLMGDASQGITVVNAIQQGSAFDRLQALNAAQKLLPEIKSRDNAPNSDHYPFTKAAVPAIFIYANGGKGHYHDIFDKPKELSLNNIPQVFQLLTQFVASF